MLCNFPKILMILKTYELDTNHCTEFCLETTIPFLREIPRAIQLAVEALTSGVRIPLGSTIFLVQHFNSLEVMNPDDITAPCTFFVQEKLSKLHNFVNDAVQLSDR